MAQLKPCPPSKIKAAEVKAGREGQRCFVLFDSLMVEHKVVTLQTYRGGNYSANSRYEIVAIVDP